jgi:choline dehydrogenase-like flavoprotein
MFADARTLSGNPTTVDVCVIGAGPAGISLARRLSGRGLSILVLESGSTELDLEAQELNRGEIAGEPYVALESARLRCFGGTSAHWTGWCRPLGPGDFRPRDWVPHSGWPISANDLDAYYREAQELCGLGDFDYRPETWAPRVLNARLLDLRSPAIETILWQLSAPVRFGTKYRSELERAGDVAVHLHATALELEAPSSARVKRVRVGRRGREPYAIEARVVVLAAGALENARLLLASDSTHASGLGNEHGLVGRFFAEHPHALVGKMLCPHNDRSLKLYQWVNDIPGGKPAAVRAGFALSADACRKEKLLGVSFTVDPALELPPAGPFRDGMRRLLEELYGGRARALDIYVRAEQSPDPESRVRLSDARDAFGMRRVVLEWHLDELTKKSIRRGLELLAATMGRAGIGRIFSYAHTEEPLSGAHWPQIGGGFHHMGTTRMADAPERGVVDSDCRVFGLENLYVAGSSVFPTSGLANPTLTLVALALRLADRISEVLT